MKHSAAPLLALLLTLVGCSALPPAPGGKGVFVLPYTFENHSAYTDPINKYELLFNDGTSVEVVPGDNFLVLPRQESFRLERIRSSLNLQNWQGGTWEAAAPMDFPVLPGLIVLSDQALVFTQEDAGENNRLYHGGWKFRPVTEAQRTALEAQLRADPNFPAWSLY